MSVLNPKTKTKLLSSITRFGIMARQAASSTGWAIPLLTSPPRQKPWKIISTIQATTFCWTITPTHGKAKKKPKSSTQRFTSSQQSGLRDLTEKTGKLSIPPTPARLTIPLARQKLARFQQRCKRSTKKLSSKATSAKTPSAARVTWK